MEKERILPDVQSGFRAGYSAATAMAHVADDIISNSDNSKGSILVLLDFTRAFDSINLDLLLAKLSYYGVDQDACSWFKSFLTNRRQFVAFDAESEYFRSEVKPVDSGAIRRCQIGAASLNRDNSYKGIDSRDLWLP
ncbi:unnamed protein product [Leptosia nina]|uniref:Reverse transcriptase domain-containing protein n=1 Tax=Leptosia nina TaxID=320188 RepID=A0AAV1JKY7_9NEOP